MHWFTANAPIRQKLFVAFGSMTVLAGISPLALLLLPKLALIIGLGATLTAAGLGTWYRSAIATPYVTTVLRMEALAAGDLASPIQFTEYRDCVGRLTKAMFAFRDTAAAQITANAESERHGEIVRGMTGNLRRLAEGDLTADITEEYPAVYAGLRGNFNEALSSLRNLLGSVTESTIAIRTGSGEIAQASENLARRTEANAASLEQTSAAITQMDQRLKATAEAASRTVARADGATATVAGGREVVDQAVQAMKRVNDSAKGIDSVIEGLDKIAFQTRVLAMNAAVEAGRAGEAGRGFAVVADLVSALAMRAEEEAGRAREQLTATQVDIVAAVEMVEKVDGALENISGDVNGVHELLNQMAADNQAQSTAISEISTAIGTMDVSTQQNAAMVEETSAAARNLTGEVAMLAEQAARFQIEGGRKPLSYPTPGLAASTGVEFGSMH
ncbi:methyl-accepting chemotaxis protein [Sphingomonas sp. R-74633]|uniref:methyl-accepting chemotaxis protein n=1 Tax=Sphingomonas sp. R-74633 TaxID=2751188 RepID=UPI0015D3C113|nr:methyl-accepting chemotaxis protein [Sphingomonas sp. R-74633]NYT40259.1 methyl-accepting chemotaxis protein [Sphingomonas sp. R-74633]